MFINPPRDNLERRGGSRNYLSIHKGFRGSDAHDLARRLFRHRRQPHPPLRPHPITILPLGTVEAFVPVEDTRGGTGANFILEWAAAQPTAEPLVEAIMIGREETKGFTFTSRGVAASARRP